MTTDTRLQAIKLYISLTKPGVLFGNVITGAAGFGLASSSARTFLPGLFIATIIGMTCIIGSACALNNVFDRDIDRMMSRTKGRAVPSGNIPPRSALIFAVLLTLIGAGILALWTSWLVLGLGLVGLVVYVWLYGMLTKRRSMHGTLVGSISGALPILAGYVSARGSMDVGAILVFLALFFWQFPEFYSIAIYRQREYAAAKVPVITVAKSVSYTKRLITVYAVLFVLSALLLTRFGYTGYSYLAAMAIIGGYWLLIAMRGFRADTVAANDTWARQMFHASINVILLYSLLIIIGPLLP